MIRLGALTRPRHLRSTRLKEEYGSQCVIPYHHGIAAEHIRRQLLRAASLLLPASLLNEMRMTGVLYFTWASFQRGVDRRVYRVLTYVGGNNKNDKDSC